ncbi:34827_t:CDS:1 [Racocetra persica]|uniref:34827_t:CDS:1 n=1 Tax=Racocetra persica TaxID=160502 RepID=A0ACA9M131_9GLOM|nr:34827_t:CDS:1 [Racocetra persica]
MNIYNILLSLFIVIDNIYRSCLIVQAILDNEIARSYSWLLEILNKATDKLCLKTILTDANPAISLAISSIMLSALHLYCIWHISQNLQKKLKNKLGSSWDSFIKDFYKTHNILDLQIFEIRFKALLKSYPKAAQYFNKVLYPNRHS